MGVNEWPTRWRLSEGVDSLDNWDCFLGVSERCSRNGLHLNHTEAQRLTVNKIITSPGVIFLLMIFCLFYMIDMEEGLAENILFIVSYAME